MLVDLSFSTTKKFPFHFKGQTWSIQRLYLTCLGKYNTNAIKKVVIEFTLSKDAENNIEYLLDVIRIKKTFDFEKYFLLSEKYEKKKMLLEALHESMTVVANHEGWSVEPLKDAYNCCLAKNLEHTWLRKDKYFLSPNRKYYGGVFCNWDIDKFEAFAVFLNKQKEEISRIKLFEREPWDVDPMGKMGWDKGTGEFYLYSKDEKTKWKAAIPHYL